MDTNQAKDQNVVSFMMQLIQEKHGDEVDINFLNQEAIFLHLNFVVVTLHYSLVFRH